MERQYEKDGLHAVFFYCHFERSCNSFTRLNGTAHDVPFFILKEPYSYYRPFHSTEAEYEPHESLHFTVCFTYACWIPEVALSGKTYIW